MNAQQRYVCKTYLYIIVINLPRPTQTVIEDQLKITKQLLSADVIAISNNCNRRYSKYIRVSAQKKKTE